MPTKKPDEPSQLDKFKEAARKLGADVSPESLDQVIGSVGKAPPKKEADARKEEGKPPR